MPQRNSTGRGQPTTALRRTPRLLRTALEDPKNPDPKSRTNRVPHSDPPPPSSARKGSLKKTQKHCPEEVSKKVDESECGSKISKKSHTGSKRSARLIGAGCLRGSLKSRGNGDTADGFVGRTGHEESKKEGLSDVNKAEDAINLHKWVAGNAEKRVTRNSSLGNTNVHGKSAQDCFDKVHSDHLTPPQPRIHSRASKTNSLPLSLSASTFLKSSESKIKRPNGRKQRSHLAQKTLRQLLQKHHSVDQDFDADLFSVIESSFNPSTQAFRQGVILSSPTREQEKPGYLKKWHERSSSARKKHLSRLKSMYGATLVSPPVLKQVKNKALHEKYIDQLHCREAKRKAASAQTVKSIPGKEDRKKSHVQHLKDNAPCNFSDFDADRIDADDDEGEQEP